MTATALFSPPPEPASLYFGDVMHARLKPVGHRFNYKVFCLLADVDALETVAKLTPLFSVGRFNLLSFYPGDHGGGKRDSLRLHIEGLLQPGASSIDRIFLLCYPRMLGFVFNPISVYFCYRDGELAALVYEVRNTFGQIHSYVAPVAAGEMNEAGVRQERAKQFYVSPFMDMNLVYKFRIRPPGATIALRILETDETGPVFSATFCGERTKLSSASVLRGFFGLPLMTLRVVFAIHWQALKLWAKGMRLRTRPPAPPRSSVGLPPAHAIPKTPD